MKNSEKIWTRTEAFVRARLIFIVFCVQPPATDRPSAFTSTRIPNLKFRTLLTEGGANRLELIKV